ncbi:MAG: hypothetical protein WCX28_00060 [Bacteriovoracaceae bacterium]
MAERSEESDTKSNTFDDVHYRFIAVCTTVSVRRALSMTNIFSLNNNYGELLQIYKRRDGSAAVQLRLRILPGLPYSGIQLPDNSVD